MLVSQGGVDGGFTFFVQGGKLRYTYNYVADQRFQLVSDTQGARRSARAQLRVRAHRQGRAAQGQGHARARCTLFIDGKPAGEGKLPVTIPLSMGLAAGVSIGADAGAPVTDEYEPPFAFTGTIEKVVYDVSGKHVVDHEAEIRMALARQ